MVDAKMMFLTSWERGNRCVTLTADVKGRGSIRRVVASKALPHMCGCPHPSGACLPSPCSLSPVLCYTKYPSPPGQSIMIVRAASAPPPQNQKPRKSHSTKIMNHCNENAHTQASQSSSDQCSQKQPKVFKCELCAPAQLPAWFLRLLQIRSSCMQRCCVDYDPMEPKKERKPI